MSEPLICDVAIVGGGPAGVAAALELRRRGVERVVILEREEAAGGVPRHCGHPPFGMREFRRILAGPTYARKLCQAALAAGVDIRPQTAVTTLRPFGELDVVTPTGPAEVVARRVVLATGGRESPRSARRVSGDRPVGVITTGTLQQSVYIEGLKPFRRPVVVGTELVSLSSVLTCRKAGIRPVAVVENGSRPTARRPLDLFPRLLGIPMHYCAEIIDIRGRSRVEAVTVRVADGSLRDIACDGVLFTGRFVPEAALVRLSHLRLDAGSGGPEIDQFGRCSDPSYFAAGNLLRPIETAGWSYCEGRCIGGFVADDLEGRLIAATRSAAIERGPGVKLVVPQQFALPSLQAGLRHLQLRAEAATAGLLTVRRDGVPVWQKRMSVLPERRILVPLSVLEESRDAHVFSVGFQQG